MATIFPTSVPSKRLSEALTASGTSFKVSDITHWSGSDLVAGDFGTLAYGVFRNANNTQIEVFEFDPATIADTSIDILRRGLSFSGEYSTEVPANKKSWGVGTIVEFGAPIPQLLKHYVTDIGDQTIAGIKTFSSLPSTTAGDPILSTDLARKAYVDAAVAGIATTVNLIVPGTAGATITAGDLIYFDDADNEWKPCDADTAATVENVMLAMAQGSSTDGNTIPGGVLLRGLDANQTGLTAGVIYYASNTAGDISSSAGTQEVTIGFAYSTTQLYFNPRFNQEITELQQDYLEKASTNLEWYGASVVGTDSYAITVTPTFAAYVTGNRFSFKADVANTGAATLNVNGLGAITIKKQNDQDLVTGDIEAGQVVSVQYDGTNLQMQSQAAVAPATVDIQTFTSSGTWTKPAGALAVEVYAYGAGGGAGSGPRNSSPANLSGGSGGAGGSVAFKRFLATSLSATETITVGTGGAGGVARTGSNQDGANGSAGGNTTFGTSTLLKANGGAQGIGGNGVANAGGAGGVVANGERTQAGGDGGQAQTSDTNGSTGVDTATGYSPRGGGAGGGFNAVSASKGGGAGGGFITNFVLAGGTANGGAGNAGTAYLVGGTGGGGGDAGSTGVTGGAGGAPGGGGGGGGGGTSTSGAGGAGSNGAIIVITYF